MEYNGFCELFLPFSALCGNICVNELYDIEKTYSKDTFFTHSWLFHQQAMYRRAICQQKLHWKIFFADRRTDGLFVRGTNISLAVVDLKFKLYLLLKTK